MAESYTDSPLLTARFDDALHVALRHHDRQLRKGTQVPYAAHLLAVASLALEMHCDEDEAIAALLHDVVEDGGGQDAIDRIGDEWGPHVLGMVLANSDTIVEPKPPWRARKEAYIAGIATKERGALRVSLADKLHNARAILLDYRTHGEALWSRFKAGEGESVRWYYRSLCEAFEARADELGEAAWPVLGELRRTVDELDGLASGRMAP